MKILMLASYLPYPLFSGGHIRLYNLIKQLSKRHEITLICEKRDYQTQDDIDTIAAYCLEVIAVPRMKQWTIENIMKTGFSPYPFLIVGHTNAKFKEAVQKKLKEPFDLVHIETFYVMQNLSPTKLPTVLVEHNVEYLVYDRYRKNAPFFLWPLLFFDIVKLKYWERYFWKRAMKLVAVSEVEKKEMQRDDVVVVPNGVDTEKFKISEKEQTAKGKKRILFIGDFRWVQNRDAVAWLLVSIWPKISFDCSLWIVGKQIPTSLKRITQDSRVIFDENAPNDTARIFQEVDVLIAPIRVGGGTSYKILEAMASGVPVVTTQLGIEGLEVRDKEEVLVGDSAEALAQHVNDVVSDIDLNKKLTQNARKRVEEMYDWSILVKKLEHVYDEVTRNSREY